MDVGEQPHAKTVWRDLTDDVIDQLWAEAKARWQAGESLYLSGDVEQEAKNKQPGSLLRLQSPYSTPRNRVRNSFVSRCWGSPKTCAGVPCSQITP